MKTYTKDELKKLQKVDLEISKYFVEFCRKHNLTCYFCGGGCIGAIRHNGFIPWDDDLDFFMPRDSYNQLIAIWNNDDNAPYILRTPNAKYNDHDMFTTIRDTNTTMIKEYQKELDIPHGIAIDIFPLDGCPSFFIKRLDQLFWAFIYQIYCVQSAPTNHGKMISFIGKVLLGVAKKNTTRYKIWSYAQKRMSKYRIEDCKYITEICAGPKYMFNQYPKEAFEETIYHEFEGVMMPIPGGYDAYLRMAFGDYMVLPAENKRVSHHNNVVVDCNKSYTEYKGVAYCVK